jgi:hypothetical protein
MDNSTNENATDPNIPSSSHLEKRQYGYDRPPIGWGEWSIMGKKTACWLAKYMAIYHGVKKHNLHNMAIAGAILCPITAVFHPNDWCAKPSNVTDPTGCCDERQNMLAALDTAITCKNCALNGGDYCGDCAHKRRNKLEFVDLYGTRYFRPNGERGQWLSHYQWAYETATMKDWDAMGWMDIDGLDKNEIVDFYRLINRDFLDKLCPY